MGRPVAGGSSQSKWPLTFTPRTGSRTHIRSIFQKKRCYQWHSGRALKALPGAYCRVIYQGVCTEPKTCFKKNNNNSNNRWRHLPAWAPLFGGNKSQDLKATIISNSPTRAALASLQLSIAKTVPPLAEAALATVLTLPCFLRVRWGRHKATWSNRSALKGVLHFCCHQFYFLPQGTWTII